MNYLGSLCWHPGFGKYHENIGPCREEFLGNEWHGLSETWWDCLLEIILSKSRTDQSRQGLLLCYLSLVKKYGCIIQMHPRVCIEREPVLRVPKLPICFCSKAKMLAIWLIWVGSQKSLNYVVLLCWLQLNQGKSICY